MPVTKGEKLLDTSFKCHRYSCPNPSAAIPRNCWMPKREWRASSPTRLSILHSLPWQPEAPSSFLLVISESEATVCVWVCVYVHMCVCLCVCTLLHSASLDTSSCTDSSGSFSEAAVNAGLGYELWIENMLCGGRWYFGLQGRKQTRAPHGNCLYAWSYPAVNAVYLAPLPLNKSRTSDLASTTGEEHEPGQWEGLMQHKFLLVPSVPWEVCGGPENYMCVPRDPNMSPNHQTILLPLCKDFPLSKPKMKSHVN